MRELTDLFPQKRKNTFKMKHLHGIRQMTDHLMFEGWAGLLRPLFPAQAAFTFKSRRRVICVNWPDQAGGQPGSAAHSVVIAFTQMAWKSYRGARAARRSRADMRLVALITAALAQHEAESAGEAEATDLQISVAAVDIFPPPAALSSGIGERLAAG